jgi:hypothetical protein
VLPHHQRADGLLDAYFMLDKAGGKGIGIAIYKGPEHAKANEADTNVKRAAAIDDFNGELQGVDEFEVVSHHHYTG